MAQDSTEIRKKLFRSPMVEGDRLAGTDLSIGILIEVTKYELQQLIISMVEVNNSNCCF